MIYLVISAGVQPAFPTREVEGRLSARIRTKQKRAFPGPPRFAVTLRARGLGCQSGCQTIS
jgi:hypothetical protein